MKKHIKTTAIALMIAFGLVSCVQPTGTPAQQARQTEANAQLANGVGMALLGAGAAAFGAAQLNNSYGNYYYGGRHYYNRGYRHGHYYYY